jgi:uncharacterized RDD family membrane protein YckC
MDTSGSQLQPSKHYISSHDCPTKAAPPKVTDQPRVSPAAEQQERALDGNYAGIGQRGVALVIDVAIVLAFWMGFGFVLSGLLSLVGVREPPWMVRVPLLGILLSVPWLYHAKLESSALQATVGKWIFRIRVTDVQGNRIGFGRATGRYFGKWLSYWTICIGFVVATFTRKQQALHDLLAGTLVVRGRADAAHPAGDMGTS